MTGRNKTETTQKVKLPEVPSVVVDNRNNKQYKKGEFLGKVSFIENSFNLYRYMRPFKLLNDNFYDVN